jgi:hypothetical protein
MIPRARAVYTCTVWHATQVGCLAAPLLVAGSRADVILRRPVFSTALHGSSVTVQVGVCVDLFKHPAIPFPTVQPPLSWSSQALLLSHLRYIISQPTPFRARVLSLLSDYFVQVT